MQNSTFTDCNFPTERQIILLDGRTVKVPLFSTYSLVNHDQLKVPLKFGIFVKKLTLDQALANIITDMLSTHSIKYISTILNAFDAWTLLPDFKYSNEIDFTKLQLLQKIQSSYPAFILPILRKLSLNFPNLVDDEVKDFLNNPTIWEERNPAYFKLIVNDPEKGVFTTQELENLHDNLNLAFSQKKISQFDYTLAWFFIATGARPVQILNRTGFVGDHFS